MEDPIVKLLDGTELPKSQVPLDTIYINEKGQRVKKVKKVISLGVNNKQIKASPLSFKSGIMAAASSLAAAKLPGILKNIDLSKITDFLKEKQKMSNLPLDGAIKLVQSLNGGIDKNGIMGLAQNVNPQQISSIAGQLNMPWLNTISNILGKIAPAATPIQQFNNYLDLAMEDGIITDGERNRITELGRQAGLRPEQIQSAINNKTK